MKTCFIHIPKNAGSFVSTNLAENYGYEKSFGVDLHNISLDHFVKYRDNIVERYDFVTGHVPFSFISDIASKFGLIFCVIRSPLHRLISMFYYRLQRNQIAGDANVVSFVEFVRREYLSVPATRNEQCGYIGMVNRFSSVLDVVEQVPQLRVLRFDDIEREMQQLCNRYNFQYKAFAHRNETKWRHEAIIEGLTTESYAEIRNWFDDDYQLFEYFCEKGKN